MSTAYALPLWGSGVQRVPLPKGVGRGSSCTVAARSCTGELHAHHHARDQHLRGTSFAKKRVDIFGSAFNWTPSPSMVFSLVDRPSTDRSGSMLGPALGPTLAIMPQNHRQAIDVADITRGTSPVFLSGNGLCRGLARASIARSPSVDSSAKPTLDRHGLRPYQKTRGGAGLPQVGRH